MVLVLFFSSNTKQIIVSVQKTGIDFLNILKNSKSDNFELLDREVEIEILPPYTVIVMEEVK